MSFNIELYSSHLIPIKFIFLENLYIKNIFLHKLKTTSIMIFLKESYPEELEISGSIKIIKYLDLMVD